MWRHCQDLDEAPDPFDWMLILSVEHRPVAGLEFHDYDVATVLFSDGRVEDDWDEMLLRRWYELMFDV